MRYRLLIDEGALEQLRALPKDVRRNIGHRLDLLGLRFNPTAAFTSVPAQTK
ncbi:MAG TPA: hypothetical protein VH639_14930 [Bryobacteraceae bacterium]|jgi:mRNA-degrading endonuclease RelE of RelBE toxin-antitoxin system